MRQRASYLRNLPARLLNFFKPAGGRSQADLKASAPHNNPQGFDKASGEHC
jgi:hypothetical protein